MNEEDLFSINFGKYEVISDSSRSKHKDSGGLVILKKCNVPVNIVNMNNVVKEIFFEVLTGLEIVLNENLKITITYQTITM